MISDYDYLKNGVIDYKLQITIIIKNISGYYVMSTKISTSYCRIADYEKLEMCKRRR